MMFKRILPVVAALAVVVTSLSATAQTIADRLNTMGAQVTLLNKEQELYQALQRSAGTDAASLPKVIAVYGMDRNLQARLLLPSGVVSNYQEGDTIRGSMKIAAITAKAVLITVSNGKKVATLPLDFVAGGQQAAGGAPGIPSPLGGGAPGSGGPLPPELLPPPPSVGAPMPPPARGASPAAASAAPAPAVSAAAPAQATATR
jgi:type IV pilus biogenesis protein PilP